MAIIPRIPALAVAAAVLLSPLLSYAQGQFRMKVYLGPMNELEVDAAYHDPSDIDQRLNGTRVIPIWLSVTNRSSQPIRLDYQDLSLDLGSAASATPLWPVGGDTARAMLLQDGRYNAFLRFLASQGNDYAGEPFSRLLPDDLLGPGRTKRGYVFFVRPDGVPFTGFLALGTVSYKPEMLRTKTYEVRSPKTESARLWDLTWLGNRWDRILYGAPPFNKSYALLLGVSDYRYLERLSLVNDDLRKMETFLLSLGFHVVRVQNEKLTMAAVRSPQQYLADKVNPDDRLLVYFAGHGFHRMEGGKERGYLALIDAKQGEVSRENTIAMDDFVAWARQVPAKHLLVLLDSCFSGLAVRGSEVEIRSVPGPQSPSRPDPKTLYRLSAQPGRYLLMAGNEKQKAIASPTWKGGLFTHAVVQGLGGQADTQRDGFVTTRELYPWLRDYVEAEASKAGVTLTPMIKDLGPYGSSEGEFVFTRGR
ncbi:MAG TPA: caspase family protein [Vicinamibacterales bacterium]